MWRFTACLLAVGLGCFGCIDGEFDPLSTVTRFQIMGMNAEPPELREDAGVTFDALWADPTGQGRGVWHYWFVCMDSSYFVSGVSFDFCEPIGVPYLDVEQGGGQVVDLPTEMKQQIESEFNLLPREEDERFYFDVVLLLCAGGAFADLGEASILDFCEGGEGLTASKSVYEADRMFPNENPRIDRLRVDGALLLPRDEGGRTVVSCVEGDSCGITVELALTLTEDSFQEYERDGHELLEYPLVSWYVSSGDIRDETFAHEPAMPHGNSWSIGERGVHTLWIVVRDSRGGASWKIYEIEAR